MDTLRPTIAAGLHALKQLGLGCCVLALSACASLQGLSPPVSDVQATPTPHVVLAPAATEPPAAVTQVPVAPVAPAPTTVLPGASASGGLTTANDALDVVAAPVDPLRPEVRVNLEDRSARLDLWERVRVGFGVDNLDGDLVRKAEQLYAKRPDYVQRMTERGGRYLFHIIEEVQRRNLPTELALLPFVESAFNPEALSHASASGMWQFMPATGRVFNLKQNVFRDDRRGVLESTRAALDYLVKLHGMFGNWHLALAAYNWGEGSVKRAINRNKLAGLPTDYQSLSMPNETRFYVPKLQAVKNIVANPQTFGLTLPPLENHPYFLSVGIERDMDVDLAARLANIPIAEFKALNPQLNRSVILAAGTPQLLMPYDNANTFVKAVQRHAGQFATWTAWTVPQTMKSAEAAKRAGMPEATFLAINHIPPRMVVQAGSTVLVPRTSNRVTDVSEQLADNASLALAHESPPMRKLTVRVGRGGESVAGLAKRYRVSAAQVAAWNKVAPSAQFSAGATVVLQVPAKAKRTQTARHGKAVRTAKAGAKGTKSSKTKTTKIAAARRTAVR